MFFGIVNISRYIEKHWIIDERDTSLSMLLEPVLRRFSCSLYYFLQKKTRDLFHLNKKINRKMRSTGRTWPGEDRDCGCCNMARVLLLAKYNVRGEKSLKSLNIRRMKMGVMSWTFSLYYFSFAIRELFFKGQLQLHWISFLTVIAFPPPTHIILPPIVNALCSALVYLYVEFFRLLSLGPLHRTLNLICFEFELENSRVSRTR